MPIANTISEQLERASWIRRMFEEGIRLRGERGAENVFDFTLGKPGKKDYCYAGADQDHRPGGAEVRQESYADKQQDEAGDKTAE